MVFNQFRRWLGIGGQETSKNTEASARFARSVRQSVGHDKFIDPAALLKLKSLELKARTVVDGFLRGLHHSSSHGFSAEFVEYRQYVEGDDPRYIDWRVCARTDRYFVRKYEEETNLDCSPLLDLSASMKFAGSVEHSKLEYARALVATLAYYLHLQGESPGLTLFDQAVRCRIPCSRRSGQLHRMFIELEKAVPGKGTALDQPFDLLVRTRRRRGLIVLFSDLLVEVDMLETKLSELLTLGHEVVIFRVLDRRELDFDYTESDMSEDLETGQALVVDPDVARAGYRERFGAQAAKLGRICRSLGIQLHQVVTDEQMELALFEFLKDRKRLRRIGLRRHTSR